MKKYIALALTLLFSGSVVFGASRIPKTINVEETREDEASSSLTPEDAAAIKRTLQAIRTFIERGEPIDKSLDWDMEEDDWYEATRGTESMMDTIQ